MITSPANTMPHPHPSFADNIMQSFDHIPDYRTFASLRRMVAHQQSKPLLKRTDFMKQAILYLPEVVARIEESDFGILHLEVGAMRLATRDAIVRRDFATVRRHLLLIAELFERADAELYEAIRISYLEALFLDETSVTYGEARGLLSRPMENVLRQAEAALERRRCAAAD